MLTVARVESITKLLDCARVEVVPSVVEEIHQLEPAGKRSSTRSAVGDVPGYRFAKKFQLNGQLHAVVGCRHRADCAEWLTISATGGSPETFRAIHAARIIVGVHAATEPPLLDRDRELAVLSTRLEALSAGAGGFVVVVGPAGIGKTRLLAAVEQLGRGAGVDVLRAAGAEFERNVAFGAAAQLFDPPLRSATASLRAELLEGAAGLGGELLGFGTGRVDGTGDPRFAAFHGLYWLCVNLATRAPLALLIDDAHWLDEQSLAWVGYLARRLEGLPVLVVVATRPEEQLGQRLARTAIETHGELVELQPLSAMAVAEITEASLDQPAEPEFAKAFAEATGGNPFLVHELLRTIREEGMAPDAHGARLVKTLGSDRIGRAVLVRLHRLSPDSVELARAIAILRRGGTLSVAARLAELDDATAARAVERLVAANILAPGTELQFHHPVVQASIYQDLPAPARALRHRQAARLLGDVGAPIPEVASQLLEAEPTGDSWAIALLRSAAADASSRGAPHTAITFLERALAELPASENADLLLALGRAAHAALEIAKAIDALSRAFATAEPADRGAPALELARVLLHTGRAEDAVRLLKAELATGEDLDQELRVWLEVEYALYAGPLAEALPTTQRFRAFEGRDVAELAALAVASSMADTADKAAALAQRALCGGVLLRAPEAQSAWFLAPWMLIRADHLSEAASNVREALGHARASGSQLGFARASWLWAEIQYGRGDLLSAEGHLRSAYAIGSEGGSIWVRLMSGALLAQVLADRGELREAHAILATLDISMLAPHERLTRPVHYARGYVALVAGRPEEAAAEFENLTEHAPVAPAARSRFATGMAVHTAALSRTGRVGDARRLADEELAWAETWGAPRFIGIALRGSANALDDPERIQTLQKSVALLDTTSARLELARALGDLGSVLRRTNQRAAAREPLRRALDLAQRCRADGLAQQLRGELRAAGAKPRRDVLTGKGSLTASEARIAEMAATGMTNSQIGQAIFVTPGTVEKHLTSVYSKLNISSRQSLAAALGQDRDATTNARYDRPTR